MNLNDLNNEENQFPEDLNYSEDKWQDALSQIETYEKSVDTRRRYGLGALGLLFIGLLFFLFYGNNDKPSNNTNHIVQTEKLNQSSTKNASEKENKKEIDYDSESKINEKTEEGKLTQNISDNVRSKANEENSNTLSVDQNADAVTAPEPTNLASEDKVETAEVKDDFVGKTDSDTMEDNSPSPASIPDVVTFVAPRENVVSPTENLNAEEVSNEDQLTEEGDDKMLPENEMEEDATTETLSSEDSNNTVLNTKEESTDNIELLLTTSGSEETLPTPKELSNATSNDESGTSTNEPNNANVVNESSETTQQISKSDNPQTEPYVNDSLAQNIIDSSFMITKNFAIKIMSNPWVEYGRTSNWNKIDLGIGLEYENKISKQWSYSAGLDYFAISDLPQVLERSETSYGLGYDSLITSVSTEKLHMVSLPLQISYAPFKRIQVSGGLGANYIIGAENTLEKRRSTNAGTQVLSTEGSSGYLQGFKRIQPYGLVGVEIWLSSNMSIGTNYYQGIGDATLDDEFRIENIESNSRLEFNLKYLLR